MIDLPRTGGEPGAAAESSDSFRPQPGVELLQDRSLLLREINLARRPGMAEGQTFLVVINVADTKKYDEIIAIFGYKLADDLLNIRLSDLEYIRLRQPAFRVGFWSIGLVFRARSKADYDASLARLLDVLAKPVICRGIPVTIKAGVGVCDLAKAQAAAEDLLQATYLAGQSSAAMLDGWAECDYSAETDHRRAFALISDAAHSLATPNEFSLRYQARLDLRAGKADAVEAFLRWHHPVLGTVMPDEFIPLIEMTGLIRELTHWVLTNAIAQACAWHVLGHRLKICVKISAQNLYEEDFPGRVAGLLESYGLSPAFLELEISERRTFPDMILAGQRLRELRALGVNVSLDDFGTGPQPFAALEHFPANALKLDRRLVQDLDSNPRMQALLRSIIVMAHDLDMYVVAEGVETQAVLEMLARWRCDYAEGFLINRPMPAEAFTEWFSSRFKKVQ